jgi:hypothetical protein
VQFGTIDWHEMIRFGIVALVLVVVLVRLLIRG